jgi:multiple sugar transport system substrate-binding protein
MSWKNVLTGLPTGTGPNLYYYNADLFRRAGMKTPQELYKEDKWTWEAFLDAAQRLTKRQGDRVEVAGFDQGLHRLWMNAAGSEEFDSYQAPTKCLYDTPPSIDALRFLQDSRHKHLVQPVNFSRDMGMDTTKAFVAGTVAMMARWSSGIGVFRTIDTFKWGMVPYPKRKEYAVDYATSGMSVSRTAKHHDASWAWNNFHAGPEGGRESATDGTGVPFHPETQQVTLEAHRKMTMLETPGFHIDILRLGKYSHVRLLSKDETKIQSEFIGPATGKIWRAEESADTAAKALVAQLNEWLRQNPQ